MWNINEHGNSVQEISHLQPHPSYKAYAINVPLLVIFHFFIDIIIIVVPFTFSLIIYKQKTKSHGYWIGNIKVYDVTTTDKLLGITSDRITEKELFIYLDYISLW